MGDLRAFLARDEVRERCALGSRFGIMAYHGGNLERTTDAVAAAVAARTGASLYTVVQAPPHRSHLASTAFDPAQSASLARFLAHVDVVITIHGYGRRRLRNHLLLGGRNRDLARHVAGHLRRGLPPRYHVLDDLHAIPRELRGQHPRNPVNRPRRAGVQIELPPSIRWNWREWGWSDHAGVSRTRAIDRLIEGLAAAVEAWRGKEDARRGEEDARRGEEDAWGGEEDAWRGEDDAPARSGRSGQPGMRSEKSQEVIHSGSRVRTTSESARESSHCANSESRPPT